MSLETRKLLWRDIPGLCWDIPAVPEKLEKKEVCVQFAVHFNHCSYRIWPFLNSGKKKAHKQKSFWPVTPPATGGSPDREARGQSFMCYPRNPRNINLFVRIPDRDGPVTGATGKKFYEFGNNVVAHGIWCPLPSPSFSRVSLRVIFSPRNYRENATQNLQTLREDTLGATCSAGPFCLLPTFSC